MCSSADLRIKVQTWLKSKILERLMVNYGATDAWSRWDYLYEKLHTCKSRPFSSTFITPDFILSVNSLFACLITERIKKVKSN